MENQQGAILVNDWVVNVCMRIVAEICTFRGLADIKNNNKL